VLPARKKARSSRLSFDERYEALFLSEFDVAKRFGETAHSKQVTKPPQSHCAMK